MTNIHTRSELVVPERTPRFVVSKEEDDPQKYVDKSHRSHLISNLSLLVFFEFRMGAILRNVAIFKIVRLLFWLLKRKIESR